MTYANKWEFFLRKYRKIRTATLDRKGREAEVAANMRQKGTMKDEKCSQLKSRALNKGFGQ